MAVLIDSDPIGNCNNSGVWLGTFADRQSQSFTNTDECILDSCKLYLKKTNNPSGNLSVKIYAHSGTYGTSSIPTGSALATSENVDITTLTTSLVLYTFNFTGVNRITLSASTYYVLVADSEDLSGNTAFGFDDSVKGGTGNRAAYSQFAGNIWVPNNSDLIFYVYKESFPSITGAQTISNISSITM